MAAIVAGSSLGLSNTSLYTLRPQGMLGQATQGRAGEGVYVNAATGNLVVQNRDELVIGRGPDISILRTYNSQGLLNDDNGDNWRLGVYRRVYNLTGTVGTAGSTVTRVAEDGSESIYTYDATLAKYKSSDGSGAFDTLAFASATQTWTWTDGDTQVTERYDAANGGRITQILDPDGNGLTFTYNAAGLITQVSDASVQVGDTSGETTFLDYTGNDLTQLRTVKSGGQTLIRTRYTYDTSHRLIQVITDRSPEDASIVDGNTYTVTYTYDGTSRRVASVTQSDGSSLAIAYVLVGSDYRVQQLTDALGHVTSFAYNTTARTATMTDPLGLVTVLAYDASSRLTSVTGPAVGGASQVVTYAYDAGGNVTQVTDARGNAVTYGYDANGNRILERDAAGNTVTRTYGSKNELLTETAYLVPDPDGAGAAQPGSPQTTRYVYSGTDHPRFVVSAEGRVTEYRYNGFGQQTAAIQYSGNLYSLTGLNPSDALSQAQLNTWVGTADKSKTLRTDSTYDFRGQVASTTTYTNVDAAGNGVVNGFESVTQYVYDQAGNLLQTVDPRGVATPAGFTTTYLYDGLGRLLSTTDATGRTTLTQYDDANRKTVLTFANGLVSTSTFDTTGHLISVLQSANSLALGTTNYFYDADGRLRRTEDPTGIKTHILYDEVGRKIATIDGTGTLTEYRYDADNNLTRTIQYATALTAAQLASLVDAQGNPTAITLNTTPAGTGIRPAASGQDRSTWNAYDSANRLVKSVDELGYVTQYFYDGAGRLTDVLKSAKAMTNTAALGDTPTPASINPAATDPLDRLTRNFYDADGKLRGTLDGEGYLVEYKYDAAGQLIETVGYATVTSAGLRTTGTLAQLIPTQTPPNPDDVHSYTLYNARGQVIGVVDGERYLTEYAYDTAGNKTQAIRYATRVVYTPGASITSIRPRALSLPGAVGSYASTPDTPANSVTGDLDLRAMIAPTDWTPAALEEIIDKSATDSSQFSYLLRLNPDGTLALYWSSNGTALTQATSTAAVGALDGTAKWVRAVLDVNNGAVGRDIKFYTSDDGVVYTQLGATVTQAGTTSVFDGTAPLRVGARNTNSDSPFAGKIYYAEVRNGIDGAAVARFNPAADATPTTTTTFTSSTGELWTLAGAAALNSSNPQDQVSTFTYTALNQLASATDFENTRTEYTYDEVGNLTKTVSAVSTLDVRTLTAQYDKQGRLTAELSGVGSALLTGNQTQQQIDAIWAANATKYAYDAAGRRTSSTDPNGNRTLYYYDADGHLTHSINAAGEVRESKYNVLGQLTQTIAYGTRLTSTTLASLTGGLGNAALTNAVAGIANAALDSVTSYTYTARGQVASSTDPLLFATNNTYDAFGDLTGSSQQIGAGQTLDHTYDFDRRGLLTRTVWDPSVVNASELRQYDAFGRVIQTTDANNNVRTQTYDRVGRAVTTTVDPGAGHLAIGTSTTYDAFDRVLTQRDALNNVTTFSYDKTNRSVTMLTPEQVSVTTVHNRQGETQSVTDGRGNVSKYDYDLDGNLKQVTRTNAQAQAISTTVNTYDKADRLTDTQDAVGNFVHYTYDAANRVLTRVVDPGNLNLTTTYEYDAKGQTTKVTDARGFATQTQFDLKGQVTSVIVDPGTGHLNLTTTYSYVGKKTLTVTEGAAGANPKVTKYTYDNLGRRIQEQVDPNVLNLTTTYTYDKKGNVVSKTEAVGRPEARTTRYVYDAADRLVWTIDALGDVTKNEYDADGRVTRTIAYAKPLTNFATLPPIAVASDVTSRLSVSAGDQSVNHVYDRDGREVYTIDAMGGVTQKVYDAAGNVIQSTAYAGAISVPAAPTPAGVAALVSASNPDNRTTRAVYDAVNRAIFVIDGMNYVTQRFYDGDGNVTKEVEYANALQGTFTAGSAPQILTTAPVPPSGSWVIVDAVHDQTTRQIYDAAGRMRYGVDAEGYVTERRLDAMGNETSRIRYADRASVADGATVATMAAQFPSVPASAIQELATYDNAGRVFEVTDGEGAVTRNLYDALGNKTDVIRAFGASAQSTTHYVYDAAGRLKEETAAYGTTIAATTRYVLDALGNRRQIIDPRGVELAESNTAWAQNVRLQIFGTSDLGVLSQANLDFLRGMYSATQVFDKAGRKTGETDGLGNTTSTLYDARGNAVKVTDPRGNSGYFYFDANDKVRFYIDPMGYVTEYRYDAFGSVKDELHYANKLTGTYDENALVSDLASRVTTSVDDRQTSKAYDRVGQVSTITYQNTPTSYTETFQYDAFGNKTQYKDKTDAVYNYEYDRVGNLKKEIAPATDVVTGISPTVTTLNTRLTTVYDYDAVGNRIKTTEASGIPQYERFTVYKYDEAGRLTHIEAPAFMVYARTSGTSVQRTPTTDRTYDKAGNLVMEVEPDTGVVLNYYDALNRKVASVDADNALHEYEYDRAGNLVRERTYDTRLATPQSWQTLPTALNPGNYREMRYTYNANNLRTRTETPVERLYSYDLVLSNGRGYTDASVVTTTEYNANGDVVKTVDGNGNPTYQFYDAVGNHILQVVAYRPFVKQADGRTIFTDPVGYVTRWEYNAEGQVKVVTQYAGALSATTMSGLTTATDPQSLINVLSGTSNPDDRVTEYYYDRLGRVTTERKKAVTYSTVNAATGVKSDQTGDLDTRYEYDGNGKLKAVVFPNAQGRTDYVYDALGRRTQELDPQFQALDVYNQPLVTTRAETHWAYDAFGDVAVQTKLALAPADNRETRRTYDSAGRLRAEVGPEGLTTTYDYDIAGNVARRTNQVMDVDGNNHTYRCYYTYDHLNREVSHQDTQDEGTASQAILETHDTRYNAHGDIEAKGINSQYQEQYKYDKLGRLFYTNKENGTPRLYVYDGNGNAALEVQAVNIDLSTVAGPAQVEGILPTNVQITFTIYDARNQAIDVVLPPMDYGDLTSTAAVQTTGTNASPSVSTLTPTDFHSYLVAGLTTNTTPPTIAFTPPPVPQLPGPSSSATSAGIGYGSSLPAPRSIPPATPYDPIPQASINSLDLTPGTRTPVTTETLINTLSDSTTNGVRTVTQSFTRKTVSTTVFPPQGNAVTRTITTTTDVIVRTTIYTPQQPVDTYSTTGDSLTTVWAINGQYDTKVDRRVDTTTDTFHWDNSISETAQWLFPTRVDPGQVGFTAASGNVTVDTYIPPEQMISDGEGGYYWSGYYNVHVHVPPVNYGGGDPVYVTYIWENGAAVQPVPVDGNGDATWTIRYDGHSIVVTKGRYDDPNHTVLASFGMGRDTNTASVPMTYTLPDSVTVSTVDQLADNGEGGYASTGYYYVTVHVPPVNLHVGDDKYYVTYSWDNGASIAWNIPVDSNGNATQLVRYDGHGITVTKGAYGSADYVVLASFGLDRTTYNATVQMTLTPAPAVISIPVTANAARVVFTPVNGASIEAYKVRKAGTSGAGNLDANFEFEVLARLNPGTEYNYDVYAANGTQLDRVHGFLGNPASNASYYTLTDTRTVTPNSTRSDNGGPAYSQHVDPRADAGTVANNTYLRNLVIGVSQGGTNSHIIDRKQTYNAFGEVISETDGNGNVTDLVYNDLGKLITKQAPATSVYGDATRRRPTTRYYYDELGQLVGTQDAVSELSAVKYYSTRVLVAGRVEKEFDANGKSKVYRYDRLGNQRLVTDEVGQDTEYRYDRVGRLTRLIHYDTNHSQYSFDQFFYDALGNRFKHINGLGYQETYLYDGQRRVRRHISFGGAQTSYDYSYVSTLGVGGIGGYEKKTTTAGIVGNDVQLDRTDYFGKLLYHKDMGGHEFTYQYNNAGWLKQQDGTTGQHITYDYYQNGYLKTVTDTAINSLGQFQYDNNGNRIREEYSTIPLGGSQPTPYQLAKAQYDELNRVTHVNDDGRFDVTYTYDANGNRRSIVSNYSDLLTNNPQTQKFYYNYDRMNRFVTTMGQLDAAGNIVRGPDGYDIEYDGAGRRKKVYSDHLDGSSAAVHLMEEYTYDPINTVKDTFITDSTVPTAPTVRHTLRQNDVIGRVTDYTEYDTAGAQTRWVHYGYDNDNRTTLEETHDPLKTGYQSTVYHYVGGGILDYSQTKTLSEPAPGQQLANSATVTLTYTYEKWDSYKQSLVTINGAAAGTYGWKDGTSTYSYDVNGHIARVLDSQAGRTFTYINNHLGQTLRRDEVKSGGTSPSVRSFYSLNGITIGDVGTDRVLSRVDYAQALADYDSRTLEDYISRHGNVGDDGTESGYNVREKVTRDRNITQRVFPVTSADFDNNYQPITDSYPAHAAQSFVTRAGDSLQSIALALWGDSSLWYLLADANGLSGTQQLPADLRLTIPNVVTNVHNNAGTFRPYDAGLALGDTTPTLPNPPPPPQDDGCGTMGMIVVMVVVIIVCIFTEQWYLLDEADALTATAMAEGDTYVSAQAVVDSGVFTGTSTATEAAVAGAAAGNLAGQAVANMIGMQHGFSAESFISSVFTAGVGGAIGSIGSGTWGQVATAAVKNAIGQEINVITGQQEKFDWRGVAAAAVSAPVTGPISKGIANLTHGDVFASTFVSGLVSQGINVAAHRGRDINYGQIAANVFGSAIGNSLADQLTRPDAQRPMNTNAGAKGAGPSSELPAMPGKLIPGADATGEPEYRDKLYAPYESANFDPADMRTASAQGMSRLTRDVITPEPELNTSMLTPGATGGAAPAQTDSASGADMQRGVGLTLRQDMAYGPLQGAFTENEGGAAVGRTFGYARPGAESTGSAGSGLTLDGIKHTAEGLEYLADAAGAVIVKDGKWLGLGNLKYNSMTWGGNGATLGRGLALGVAENLEYFGKLAAGVGIGVSAYQTVKAYQSGDTIGAAVAFDNAVITAMCAATGPAGVVIGSLYLASEVTGLRPWASEWLGYRMTDFAEGWEQARTRTDPPVDNTPRVVSNDGGAAVSVMRPMGRRR